jgi:cytochrome c556
MLPLNDWMALAAAATLQAAPLAAVADDQDTIDYRQHVMKTMDEQAAAINMILQHRAPADNFAVHAQILAITAATAKKAFETKVPGGTSKPEVWTQWADFARQLDVLAANTAEFARVAKEGGVAAAEKKVASALSCKGCHDTYCVPKKQ